MINAATVMKQIESWLIDDANLKGHTIVRSEFVNEDANRAINGWIGLYRKRVGYSPRNLGVSPNNYDADFEFMVLVQRASILSGAETENCLEESLKWVLDRVLQLPKTYIEHFADIDVEYTYQEDADRKSMYFQGALITFTAEIDSEVK